jgi:cation diffusion facilitator CzcD-associated flavoprotein CzcO
VIGGGNSACDIASEAARVGKGACISLRRGYWFLPKTLMGFPLVDLIKGWFPVWAQRIFLRAMLRIVVGKYSNYGLPEPEHKIFEAHPTINSELLYYIKQGAIRPKPDIARFEAKTVHFVDGSSEEFDVVVCATGYHVSFPFLPAGLVPVKGSAAQTYGGCVLPDYKNIYIIGTSQVRYGFGPLVTPGVDLIARMMLAQEQMELPIGLVLKESGVRPSRSHLVDPHAAIRGMKRGKRMLPVLIWKEKRLRKKMSARAKVIAPVPVPPQIDREIPVW